MKHLKPKSMCKNCGAILKNETTKLGMSKFCSPTCYYAFQNNKKRLASKSKPKTNIKASKISKKRFGKYKPVKALLQTGKALEKDIPDRDENYLAYIRTYKCCVCGKKCSVAHHVNPGGVGSKCSDFLTLPLCTEHHTKGKYAIHNIGKEEFQKRFNINFSELISLLLINYIRHFKGQSDE